MKIIATASWDANYEPLADLTIIQNRMEYCLRHGYRTAFCQFQDKNFEDICFETITSFMEFFRDSSVDWAWFSPVDGLVTNMTITLESIIEANPGFDLIIGSDPNGINAGNMLMKNTEWSKQYLEMILSKRAAYKEKPWHEQQIIMDTYKENESKIKILPHRTMNSYDYSLYPGGPYPPGQWVKGDFIIHWPCQNLVKRIELAEKYMKEVVR